MRTNNFYLLGAFNALNEKIYILFWFKFLLKEVFPLSWFCFNNAAYVVLSLTSIDVEPNVNQSRECGQMPKKTRRAYRTEAVVFVRVMWKTHQYCYYRNRKIASFRTTLLTYIKRRHPCKKEVFTLKFSVGSAIWDEYIYRSIFPDTSIS